MIRTKKEVEYFLAETKETLIKKLNELNVVYEQMVDTPKLVIVMENEELPVSDTIDEITSHIAAIDMIKLIEYPDRGWLLAYDPTDDPAITDYQRGLTAIMIQEAFKEREAALLEQQKMRNRNESDSKYTKDIGRGISELIKPKNQ